MWLQKVILLILSVFLMGFHRLPIGVIQSCSNPGLAALTFDDGVTASTRRILDILDKHQVKAAFFFIGETIIKPDNFLVLKRSYDSGHTIGNHTWSHQFLVRLNEKKFNDEVMTAQNGFISLDKNPIKRYIRPPYGAINNDVYNKLNTLGFTVVLWNMDLKDWREHRSKDKIWASFQRQIKDADATKDSFIILLHSKDKTADILPDLITTLQAKKFQIVSLDKCIQAN